MMEHKWRKLFSYYKPYKWLFISDMFFAVIGAAVTLVIPLIVRYITSRVSALPLNDAVQMVLRLGILMIGLVLIEFVCNFYIAYYGHIMGAKIEYDMRNEIFAHYQKLSFAFYDNQKVGQLLSRVTNDLFDISELLHHGPEDVFISLIKMIGSFVILFQVNMPLTWVAFAFLPVMLIYAFYFNTKMKHAFKQNRAKIADINSQIEDNLSGIRVVKSFANEEIELKKFYKGNSKFVDAKKRSYLYMGGYNSGLGAFTTLVTVVVLMAGGMFIARGTVDAADLITFLLYINNFTEPVKKLVNFTEQFQNGYSGYERFLEILDVEPDIRDGKDAVPIRKLRGDIVFEDVSFRYEDSTDKVLHHVSLDVKAGTYIALVGKK